MAERGPLAERLGALGYVLVVRRLGEAEVSYLIDVRLTPASRKAGFSKKSLSAKLGDAGLQPAGVVAAEANLKFIWDVVSNLKVGNGGYAYVVDLQGRDITGNFEAQARTMISRLVVPYVKAAVMDRRLFQYKTHPARRLLNSLSEAVEGNKGEGPQEKELLQKAEETVDRLVAEFNEDIAIFETLEQELRSFLEQHNRRIELAERRATESQRGQERLEQARSLAAAELSRRIEDRPLPAAVNDFLTRSWSHHLSMIALREGADSAAWNAALGVADSLLDLLVTEHADAQAGQRGLADFTLERPEVVTEQEGVLWVNDSKSTNIASTLVALRGLLYGFRLPLPVANVGSISWQFSGRNWGSWLNSGRLHCPLTATSNQSVRPATGVMRSRSMPRYRPRACATKFSVADSSFGWPNPPMPDGSGDKRQGAEAPRGRTVHPGSWPPSVAAVATNFRM